MTSVYWREICTTSLASCISDLDRQQVASYEENSLAFSPAKTNRSGRRFLVSCRLQYTHPCTMSRRISLRTVLDYTVREASD